MVVSGVPKRNGVFHAEYIAAMALDIVDVTQRFKIPHQPDKTLQIRIGIHSGTSEPLVFRTAVTKQTRCRVKASAQDLNLNFQICRANKPTLMCFPHSQTWWWNPGQPRSGFSFRTSVRWCRWSQNAQVLLVWRHSQHGIQDGIKWRRCTKCFLMRLELRIADHCIFSKLPSDNHDKRTCHTVLPAAFRLHASNSTKQLLSNAAKFTSEKRGIIQIKVRKSFKYCPTNLPNLQFQARKCLFPDPFQGKGEMQTWWITRREKSDRGNNDGQKES